MAKAPPSFDFYLNDWHGGTKHLPMFDRACYFELLLYQWQNGHIPEDPQVRQHLCGCSDDIWRAVWNRIKDKFSPKELPDGKTVLVNPRMDIDRDEAIASWKPKKDVSEARRRAGRKGGIQSGRSRRGDLTPLNKGRNGGSKTEAKTKQNEAKWEGGRGKGEGLKSKDNGVSIEVETLQGETKELPIPDGVANHLGQEVLALYQTWVNVRTSNHQVNLDGPQNLLILQSLAEVPRNKRVELLTKAAMNGWKTLDNGAAQKLTGADRKVGLKI